VAKAIVVKGRIADLLGFVRLVPLRRGRIKAASAAARPDDPVNATARLMHPRRMHLRVSAVKQETDATRTFTLVPDAGRGTERLATFRAGQYLNVRIAVDGGAVTRNYSLSSTPADAAAGTYRITVRLKKNGFATERMFSDWRVGTEVESSGPVGTFYHEGLRDRARIIALAGGCGITPLCSIARDIAERGADASITILYGVRDSREAIFKEELEELARAHADRVKVFLVASEPEPGWRGPTGFLTAKLIEELAGPVAGASLFICGPQAMYRFLDGELSTLGIPRRLVRRELFGEVEDPAKLPGYPAANAGRTHTLKVHAADETLVIPALGGETILVALERAGLEPPARCRSGECGWCRARLMAGDIFVSPMHDGRRFADRKFNWVHPCSSYPLSDLEIRVNRSL
jgi:glycine betaine catabolism B